MKDLFGYLFVHFTGENTSEGEQIYFALSKDGLHYQDLNEGEPVLLSTIGEKGVRDPFMIYVEEEDKYVLIATDLRIYTGKGWGSAQYEGSRNLVLWESKDLCHFSEPKLVEVGIPEAGCVWAPEIIYDENRKEYLIFFASMVKKETDSEAKQRIYAVTTKDFHTFSETKEYLERPNHVIDTTMIYHNGKYYRYSKDEDTKYITVDVCDDLYGTFKEIHSETLSKLYGVEGPEIYPLPDGKRFCLIVDQFATQKGYLPLVTEDLESGEFRILESQEYDLGKNRKRHGGVMCLSKEEYERIENYYARCKE